MIKVYYSNNKFKHFYIKNNQRIYIEEDIDLNRSKKLLKEFNQLKFNNKYIYEMYKYDQFYYFTNIQEYAFWNFCVGVIAYRKFLKSINFSKFEVVEDSKYAQSYLMKLSIFINKERSVLPKLFVNIMSFFRILFFQNFDKIVLFDEGSNSFRYEYLYKNLKNLHEVTRVNKLNQKNISKFFKKGFLYYSFYSINKLNINKYFSFKDFPHFGKVISQNYFDLFLHRIDEKISNQIFETKMLFKYLRCKSLPKIAFFYDQIEQSSSLINYLNINNVKTYSYQHGPISLYHAGWLSYEIPYKYNNIKPYKIIVWGKYWKDFLIKYSNKYKSNQVLLGPHLNKDFKNKSESISKISKKDNQINILIPFEFLVPRSEIHEYIKNFLSFNCKIFFKIRPDMSFDEANFYLDKLSSNKNIKIFQNLDEINMDEIDVVTCSQSIFSIEMLNFNKTLWYLETKFGFLNQIASDLKFIKLNNVKLKSYNNDKKQLKKFAKTKISQEKLNYLFTNMNQYSFLKGLINK